jgi:tetratricopeptide (TPR) repeat protein/CHAT domain-containing protein
MNVEALLQQGNDAFERGEYEEAINRYKEALELDPNFHEAWTYIGWSQNRLGDPEEGIASHDKALELNPGSSEAWIGRGAILCDHLKQYEEAIASFDKAIELKPDFPAAWRNRGVALSRLDRFEEAITSCDKAIEVNLNYHEAWKLRGTILTECLGRHKEALISFNKAIQIKPDDSGAWRDQGTVLSSLNRHEDAIINYDMAIQLDPNNFLSWNNRGNSLSIVGRYEEAINSHNAAIQLNSDYHHAWYGQGHAMSLLERYEEAVKSLDTAIQLKSNNPDAWYGRGAALYNLRCYEKAITNCNEALRLTQNQYWRAWDLRGVALLETHGYQASLNNLDEGIRALLPTNPNYQFGRGQLYYRKGNTQYSEGCKKVNPLPYWRNAKDSYLNALNFLSVDDYPVEYLNTLQELHTIYTHLFSPQKSLALLQQASDVLERVLQNSVLTAGKKISLKRKFAGFNQLQVKILAQEQPIQALEHAEAHKNLCLGHLRNGWNCQSSGPSYTHIQNLLSPRTAVIYWHLSPAALTTFIIRYGQSPEVFRPKPAPAEPNVPRSQSYPPAAYQLHILENWIQEWKQNYRSYRDLDPKAEDLKAASWRKLMDGDEPFTQLPAILEINRLCEEYLGGIDQLILIPHRDLHLLPLHALFPERFTISYLPSAQMGLELHHRDPLVGDRILCIEDPTVTLSSAENKKNLAPLTFAKREVEAILHFYKATNNSLISGKLATKSSITESLSAIHDCLHFTGHGFHNIEEPLQSALLLAGDDRLTLKDIFQFNLQDCSLVCLAACETGITSTQSIIDEYMGLVSGFLAAGAAHVISTLWLVEDEPSFLLMAHFHYLCKPSSPLRSSLPPAQSLGEAQKWLKTLTYQKLGGWYKTLADELDTIDPGCIQAVKFRSLAREAYRKFEAEIIEPPYAHPYYWAGFIVTGKVPGG